MAKNESSFPTPFQIDQVDVASAWSCQYFRIFVKKGDAKGHAMRKHMWAVSEALLPRKRVFDFNQALMDLGATVCTARKPRCSACPMARMCRTYPAAGAV